MKYNFEKIFRITQIAGLLSGILGIVSLCIDSQKLKTTFLIVLAIFIILSVINVISFLKELWNS